MGFEAAKGDTEAEHEDSKIVEEARTRQLPSASPLSRSASSRASLEPARVDSIPRSKSDGDLSREQGTISTPASPVHTPQWSMVTASPPLHSPQTTSPPVQTMKAFDPDRIPASVFSSKPANATDWSTTSNDSLFSIHMGNNSFTNDLWNISPSLLDTEAKSHELCSLPPLLEVPANEEGSAKSSNVSSFEKEDPMVTSTPRLSNESGHSNSSFAFPVLETVSGKASSLKMEMVVEEKPELQTQESNANPDSTTGSWFSCLPCC